MSRHALFALVLLSLAGCGGAGASQPTTPDPAGAGDAANGAPLTLRVRAVPGARYETRAVARTRSPMLGDAVVLTDARGTLVVDSVEASTGTARLVNSIDSMRLDDTTGPVDPSAVASADLSGVTFLRTVDARGATVGSVEVRGTSELNAAVAESTRVVLEQALVRLPEGPVRVGDRWEDDLSMRLPVRDVIATLECHMRYQLAGTERSARELLAVLRFDGECHSDPITLEANGMAMQLSVETRTQGESHVAVADGLAGIVSMRTDSRSAVSAPGVPEPVVVEMVQEIELTTTPLLARAE